MGLTGLGPVGAGHGTAGGPSAARRMTAPSSAARAQRVLDGGTPTIEDGRFHLGVKNEGDFAGTVCVTNAADPPDYTDHMAAAEASAQVVALVNGNAADVTAFPDTGGRKSILLLADGHPHCVIVEGRTADSTGITLSEISCVGF
jgi:hypothetical protein